MPVPYIFANVPGGTSIPLSELDANFNYVLNNTNIPNANITGNATIGGLLTANGGLTLAGPLTIGTNTVSPTGITGTGLMVFNTGPVLVNPALGTPISGNLGNCTNFPIAQINGLASGVLPFLTAPSSATLMSAVVDETGSGQLVFNNGPTLNSPAFITPALGVPASGNLSNCNGLTLTGGAGVTGILPVANGGTGLSAVGAVGTVLASDGTGLQFVAAPPSASIAGGLPSQILYQSAVNTTSFVPNGTLGQVLLSGGTAAPTWGPVNLSTAAAGSLPIANGGTGQVTRQAALNALAGSVLGGQYLRGNGTNVVLSPIQATDIPTLNQNTTGSASTFTSITQNSQFNSVGVGTPASGVTGNISAATFTTGITNIASVGAGQTWQDVTGGRTLGTTYTNTTNRAIMMNAVLSYSAAVGNYAISIGGVTVASGQGDNISKLTDNVSLVIPAGASYTLSGVGVVLTSWCELF
jgi:hypothetical protein